ncbi:MAG: hypothetical protein KY391_03665 [Actinobacteria bacterium]|nr:hypothetical protein [Actinomycetota bacterium]
MKKAFLLMLLALVSCTANETPRPLASPSGPPSIEPETVEAHAEQFAEELPERQAGSQQEFAAATYITAHLQQAGYVVEFDAVPVANTVRSTNVVGLPPSTEDPEYVVVVAYDRAGTPASIAAFLELARALRAAVPNHSVEFVAVGAEATDVEGGSLGTRRLIKLLEDRELDPHVIELRGLSRETQLIVVGGDDIGWSLPAGKATGAKVLPDTAALYEAAGFTYTFVGGSAPAATRALLDLLIEKAG